MTTTTSSSNHGPTHSALAPLHVLTCVRVVCREYASIAAIEHVALSIDAFVCPRLLSIKSLDDAVEADSVHLLRRLLAEELASIERLEHRHEQQQQRFIVELYIASAARRALQLRAPHMHRLLECLLLADSHALGTDDVIADAAATGDLELLEWLCSACPPRGADSIDSSAAAGRAAGSGNIHVLEWLVAHRWSESSKVPVDEAVANSQLAVLHWLEQHQSLSISIGPGAIHQAAALGDLVILAWLFARPRGESATYAGDGAASGGHVHVLEWLLVNHPSEAQCSEDGYVVAARSGHLDVIKWLYAHYPKRYWTEAMRAAASRGHLSVVEFLDQKREEGDDTQWITDSAVADGHLDVAKFLYDRYGHERGVVVAAAAESGNLELVKWLHEERSEPITGVSVLFSAVTSGQLDVLEYIVPSQSGTSVVQAIESAARANRMDAIEWLYAKISEPNSPFVTSAQGLDRWMRSPDGTYALPIDAAARNGNLAMIQWLEAHGYGECSTRAMDAAAERGHLDVIKYLHANRTEGCTIDAMDDAAVNGHLDVVRWLHKNRSEGCTTDAVNYAVRKAHPRVVAFLLEHRTEGCTSAAFNAVLSYRYTYAVTAALQHRIGGRPSATVPDRFKDWRDVELIHLLYKHRPELIDLERVRAQADGHHALQRWLRYVVESE